MQLCDHTFLGITQSLCPDCLQLVPAKIIERDRRVYFRKQCPEHGVREDFVCADARWFDRADYVSPGKVPLQRGVAPQNGCPFDCGLCTEHEQHTCIGLLEITSNCNLTCPMCFASSRPGGSHLTFSQCKAAIDALVLAEGRPEVLQLSGGEPTIHPQFLDVLGYACEQPIDVVMINTNGIRFARDPHFLDRVAEWKHRAEIYLQFDGFEDSAYEQLRGEPLVETKLRAIELLSEAGFKITLVCTVQAGVNDAAVGEIVKFGMSRPAVTGISFQPATYAGRYFLPSELERRITFPDVIKTIARQVGDTFEESDFLPLPCAHPNAHSLAYAFRHRGQVSPLNRFIDLKSNMDLLANGITFTRERARDLTRQYLARQFGGCCGSDGCGCESAVADDVGLADNDLEILGDLPTDSLKAEFFAKAAELALDQKDVIRITVTSFMDAYNFDVRQLMRSCVHHVLPTGHLIPFSAYNVLYRQGHVPLPAIAYTTDSTSKPNAVISG